jgi:hypothetical protein
MYGYSDEFLGNAPPPIPFNKAVAVAAILKHSIDYPHHEEIKVSVAPGNRMLWLNGILYTFKELGF